MTGEKYKDGLYDFLWLNGGIISAGFLPLAPHLMRLYVDNHLHCMFLALQEIIGGNKKAVDRSLKARVECIQMLKFH